MKMQEENQFRKEYLFSYTLKLINLQESSQTIKNVFRIMNGNKFMDNKTSIFFTKEHLAQTEVNIIRSVKSRKSNQSTFVQTVLKVIFKYLGFFFFRYYLVNM